MLLSAQEYRPQWWVDSIARLSRQLVDRLRRFAIHRQRLAMRLRTSRDLELVALQAMKQEFACSQHLQFPERGHCESSHLSFRYSGRRLFLSAHRKRAEAGDSPSPPCDWELSSGSEAQQLRSSQKSGEA